MREFADRDGIVAWWRRVVAPTAEGLPSWRVIAAPLVIVALIFITIVSLGFTGSSTGVLQQYFSTQPDPQLVAGTPRPIRSDEWYVQTSWTISQVEQGLPIRNASFPGGMDATVQHDLPSRDWSMIFRPHLWGFLALPLANAMAVKWWLPMFALIAAAYFFTVTMLPRRPLTAILLSMGFVLQPFFAWWYLSITFWPAVWALLTSATAIWLVRMRRRGPRIALCVLTAFLTVTMAMGIYVPFMVPAVLAVLAFVVGIVFSGDGGIEIRPAKRALRQVPLLAAGCAAGGVLAIWLATRWDTIVGFTSTVYPGARVTLPGRAHLRDALGLVSAPVQRSLDLTNGAPLDDNQSEASTFFLVGFFLIAAIIWLLVTKRVDGRRRVDWLLLAPLIASAVLVAYLFVPGWHFLSRLLLLDLTTYSRARLGFALLSFLVVVVVIRRLEERRAEARLLPRAAFAATVAVSIAGVAAPILYLARLNSPLVVSARSWIIIGVLMVVAVAGAASRAPVVGALAYAVSGFLLVANVNPVYRGVFDLNDTKLVRTMKSVESRDPGRWVGVGASAVPTTALVQAGLRSFSGFQSTPSERMWEEIDPDNKYEKRWNRLANVSWVAGRGAPIPRNPAPDQIRMQFDSCAAFAQREVSWVLSDKPLRQPCLSTPLIVREGPSIFQIYHVTKR